MDKEQAANIVNVIDGGKAKEGDYAVLVAMHVNTRENRRWTQRTILKSLWSLCPLSVLSVVKNLTSLSEKYLNSLCKSSIVLQ